MVLRRMGYESLMPDDIVGYSTQPVELFGVAPVGSFIRDLFPRDDVCRIGRAWLGKGADCADPESIARL